MYVDGHLPGRYGETHKISALETMQFSAVSVVDDIRKCVTMDSKMPGDLVYILGTTHNELGGSEYYEHFGYIGLNVPRVSPEDFSLLYRALQRAIENELVASAHGVYRGGLGIHLAMVAMGGNLGLRVELEKVPTTSALGNDVILFSESAGRFIVTIDPANRSRFEDIFEGLACHCVGTVTKTVDLVIKGAGGEAIINIPLQRLKAAWKQAFGDLI
jgi:phosphoribosylformylglycinamidine synthase